MRSVAIIPARGGSKRIPRKNIRPFLGKSIISYSIVSAIESGLFDEIMVSTDDNEIADVAKKYGASVPFMRSARNSVDNATTVDVLLEVISNYEDQGKSFDLGCCIYPTAPFVTPHLLAKGIDKLLSEGLNSVFPILPFSFPIQRALKINSLGHLEMFHPEHAFTRSQDLEKGFHDSGQFYWFRTLSLLKERNMFGDLAGGIQLSELDAHDIDTEEDWQIAEFKYKLLKEHRGNFK